MKKIIILLLIICTTKAFSQAEFKFNSNGLSPDFLVLDVDSLNASLIYLKTIDWIKDTYKNPDLVIKTRFENKKVRISAFQKSTFVYTIWGITKYVDGKYSIEISFKKGRLKFEPIGLQEQSDYNYYDVDLDSNKWMLKRNGKLKQMNKQYPENITSLFNGLFLSLNEYLLKKTNKKEDTSEDW